MTKMCFSSLVEGTPSKRGRECALARMQSKVEPELIEERLGKGFCEDIGNVASRGNANNVCEFLIYKVAYCVIFHPDMFNIGVVALIFSEETHSIVVTM
jgi:hypothetical protein